jgi:hypothetical protein
MMIEGSGSGAGSRSIPLTSGSGSGRAKNMWIRIRNTDNSSGIETDECKVVRARKKVKWKGLCKSIFHSGYCCLKPNTNLLHLFAVFSRIADLDPHYFWKLDSDPD